jgi:ADP-heptose:LPS heptosyltransferase
MIRKYINPEEFKVGGEIPLLIKLRLKKLFKKKTTVGGRVLVVNTCIIGDFIATLPALRLFIQSTNKEVDLVVSPPLKLIAQSIKGVHAVFTANSIYKRSIETEAEQTVLPHEYESVLVLRISPHAYELLNHIQYSTIITYEVILLRYFAHLVWSISQKKPVRQWREVNFEIIGKAEPEKKLEFDDIFTVSPVEYDRVRDLLELAGDRKRVVIHTGSGWHVKLWDNDKWIDAIKKINRLGKFDFIFVGQGDLEAKTFEYIQQRLDFKVHSLINKVDLKTTLLIMRLSDYFIGIDSGPRNMAHLADLRSITFLGPAPKNFMPVNKADIVIDKFTCRCKSLFYFHRVSAIHKITADEVVDSFIRLLMSPARVEGDFQHDR